MVPHDEDQPVDLLVESVDDECPTCGVYVLNPALHRDWHIALTKRLDNIARDAGRYVPPPTYGGRERRAPKRREPGPTLCPRHAWQVGRDGKEPSDPCDPASTWRGGNGQEVTCDAVGNPERVMAYLRGRSPGRPDQGADLIESDSAASAAESEG